MFKTLKTPRRASRLVLALVAASLCAARAHGAASQDSGPQSVDDSALRYYASKGQVLRAEAEMRRLRALHPDWSAPADLSEKTLAAGGEDEGDLWDLFASNRLDALRAAIEARRAAEPGWEPSPDLREKFRTKMIRVQVEAMAKDQRFGDLVTWLNSSHVKLDGADVDVLWTIAEAYRKTQMNDRALDVYKGILTNDSDPGERLATIQKSLNSLRMNEVEQLLALARQNSSGEMEFTSIAVDIARARIAAFLHDERREEVAEGDLKNFSDFASKAEDPNQPALLAWYFYKLKRYQPALEWFKFSLEHGGDALVAHGLAHTLRFLGMKREAEEVAYAWRAPLVNNSILFIDILETDLTKAIPPYVEAERLARYGEVTLATASGEGAQALAWYAYNSCQFDVALKWFERAVAWHPKGPTVYGYVLTLRRLKKRREAIELINRYDGLFAKPLEILFPEGRVLPPTPCELNALHAPRVMANSQNSSVPVPATGVVRDPARQYAWGRVAGPGQALYGFSMAAMPKISRSEFPIRIALENPLRFAPVGQAPMVNAQNVATTPAVMAYFAHEPGLLMSPLVARRVPGAGVMPYERYGFALLPGYNGAVNASSPTASDQAAPAGTLWSIEPQNQLAPETSATPRAQFLGPSVSPASLPIGSAPARFDPMRNG